MHGQSVQLLYVDDDTSFTERVSEFLQAERACFDVETAADVETARARLEETQFDCVISDYQMPGENGLDLLASVRDTDPDLPFVLFTGEGSEEIAADAISQGVSDYLQKGGVDQFTVLANRVENLVEAFRNERALSQRVDAMDAVSEGIALVDSEGSVVFANRAFAEAFDEGSTSLEGVPVEDLFERPERFEDKANGEGAGTAWRGTVRLGRDGTRGLAAISVTRTADGRSVYTLRDITAEEQNREELSLKNRAMDIAPLGIIITDPSLPDNGIVYANDEFERMTGYDEAEILGENCRFLQGPETDPERVTEMREAIAENTTVTVELRNYRTDGTMFWNRVTIAPIRDTEDVVTNYVGFQQDVTEVVERRREEDAVFERVSDAFFALDDEWRFTYLNDQAERLLDRPRDALVGKSVWEEFPEAVGSPFETQYRTAVENQETVTFEEYYPPLGTWFEVRAYPSSSGLSVYFRDISQRKANERRLEQRAKQFETFGEVLAHDLRTPLLTLEGRLSLARRTGEDEQFDAAQRALERVRELVDDLATAMREGSVVNDIEPVDVGPLAEELWTALDMGGGSLTVAEMEPILADDQALTRLLQNLFRNSAEHGGGESDAETVSVTLGPLADGVGFYVEDDGPGIPEAEREKVFEPGYTTKAGGSGFGMVSVQQIALAHGWDISVTESESGGARFEIRDVQRPEEREDEHGDAT